MKLLSEEERFGRRQIELPRIPTRADSEAMDLGRGWRRHWRIGRKLKEINPNPRNLRAERNEFGVEGRDKSEREEGLCVWELNSEWGLGSDTRRVLELSTALLGRRQDGLMRKFWPLDWIFFFFLISLGLVRLWPKIWIFGLGSFYDARWAWAWAWALLHPIFGIINKI